MFRDEYNVLTRLPVFVLRSLFGAFELSFESRSVLLQSSDLSEFGMITLGFEPGNLFADRQVLVLEPPQGVLLVRS